MPQSPTRHFATLYITRFWTGINSEVTVSGPLTEITPQIPAKNGKSIEIRLPKQMFMAAFGVQKMDDDVIMDRVIGTERSVTFQSEAVNDEITIKNISILGRVLKIEDKRRGSEKKVEKTRDAHDDGKGQERVPNATDNVEMVSDDIQVSNDGKKIGKCLYCISGDALLVGVTCDWCGRHKVADGIITVIDKPAATATATTTATPKAEQE